VPKGAKPKNITHCIDCNEDLSINPKYTQGYRLSRCKNCYNKFCIGRYREYQAEFRSHPEAKLQKRNLQIERDYKISIEDYNKLLEFQGNVCAICKQESNRSLDIDHNHLTGEVRGLLCKRCNLIIGQSEEDPILIQKLYDYLDRTTWNKGLELVHIGKKA
jgi:hypothetical protein